jgi:hypothetical protein
MHEDWVKSIRNQCHQSDVAFFFKQWGGVRKAKTGRLLDGRTYDEYPSRVASPVPERESCVAYARKILDSVQPTIQGQMLIPLTA